MGMVIVSDIVCFDAVGVAVLYRDVSRIARKYGVPEIEWFERNFWTGNIVFPK